MNAEVADRVRWHPTVLGLPEGVERAVTITSPGDGGWSDGEVEEAKAAANRAAPAPTGHYFAQSEFDVDREGRKATLVVVYRPVGR